MKAYDTLLTSIITLVLVLAAVPLWVPGLLLLSVMKWTGNTPISKEEALLCYLKYLKEV